MCRAGDYWDVIYGPKDEATIEPHFCRVYGDCGACQTFDQACDAVAEFYETIAKQWRDRTHHTIQWYTQDEDDGDATVRAAKTSV